MALFSVRQYVHARTWLMGAGGMRRSDVLAMSQTHVRLAIEAHYPGGRKAFQSRYPSALPVAPFPADTTR